MKIEIEFEEVEALRRENAEMSIELYNLRALAENFNEENLAERVRRLSSVMCKRVMDIVGEKLGFTESYFDGDFWELDYRVADSWLNDTSSVRVEARAVIEKEWRKMFVTLGYVQPKLKNPGKEEENDD